MSREWRNALLGLVARACAVACFVALAGLVEPGKIVAKDYRVDKIEIRAQIRPDGSVRFIERRVYAFQGEFSWADYRLPLRGIAGVESLRVWEGDREYVLSSSGEPGTFEVDSSGNELRVKWHFRARNQTRVFELGFVVPSLVRAYPDVAEFYWNFIGAGDRKAVKEAVVRISWAFPPPADSLRIWIHGTWRASHRFSPEREVKIWVRNLAPREFLEARVLFPRSSVPSVVSVSDAPALGRVLAEEEERLIREARERTAWLRQQEERRRRRIHALWFLSFLSVAGVAVTFYLWLNFGKPHRVRGVPKWEMQPPSQRKPAMVSYLLRGDELGPEALVATLFDLARRGFVKVEIGEPEGKGRKGRDFVFRLPEEHPAGDTPEDWEKDVLDFLFGELAGGERELSHEKLKSGRRKLRRWFFDWKKKLVAAGRAEGIFEPEGRAARNRTLLLAATLMALGVVFMFVADWAGLVPFFTGIVLLATAFLMIRRSPEAQEEALRWKAFARYLRRTGKMKASGPGEDGASRDLAWVYGLVVGLRPRQFRRLTEDLFGTEAVPWLGVPPGVAAAGVASAVTSTVSAVSSAAGVGAGGSAGGAVGGAG